PLQSHSPVTFVPLKFKFSLHSFGCHHPSYIRFHFSLNLKVKQFGPQEILSSCPQALMTRP
ncbi:hypothetical protein, partial [Streptomyces clavifer]|uniref:hypothetical protein n=1 Tax=Streptomyces clavifer TaxID=68188 RepID=UPI002380CBCC